MIDVREIRANPDGLREAIRRRNVDPSLADLDRWLDLDGRKRQLQVEIDALNGEKKQLARLGKSDPDKAREQGQRLREKGKQLEHQMSDLTSQWQQILDWFPNWPHPEMPAGTSDADNVEIKAWIPGSGYLDGSLLGTGETSAASMPGRPCHAAAGDFQNGEGIPGVEQQSFARQPTQRQYLQQHEQHAEFAQDHEDLHCHRTGVDQAYGGE